MEYIWRQKSHLASYLYPAEPGDRTKAFCYHVIIYKERCLKLFTELFVRRFFEAASVIHLTPVTTPWAATQTWRGGRIKTPTPSSLEQRER